MKQIKLKIEIAIGILTFLVFASSFSYATTKLEVENVQAKPGENVIVPVTLSDNSGMVGAEVVVTYDPSKLEFVEGSNGKILEGKMGVISSNEEGKIKLACVGKEINGNGTLMSLEFKVKEEVTDASISLNLEVQKMIQDTGEENIIEVENLVKNGKILVLKEEEIKKDSDQVVVNKQPNGNYVVQVSSNQGSKVMYTSSDSSIATIDEQGNVIPKKSGTVEIIATLEDGTKEKVSLTIPDTIEELKDAKEETFQKSGDSTLEDSVKADDTLVQNTSHFFSKKMIACIIVVIIVFVILVIFALKKKGRKK